MDNPNATGERQERKRRSGSETRQQTAKLQFRTRDEVREAIDEAARRQGFKDAKELVMFRLRADIVLVNPDLANLPDFANLPTLANAS